MENAKKALGREGERVAELYLVKKGYRVVERNYRCRGGEVDLILLDRRIVVFVEVKTRSDHGFGNPLEAVEPRKQRRMILAARLFIHQHKLHERDARFDVVGISWPSAAPIVEHVQNAFEIT